VEEKPSRCGTMLLPPEAGRVAAPIRRAGEGSMRSYNLFRHKGRNGLICAVPEERRVPVFLESPIWHYSGRIRDGADAPLGFDAKAADAGVRFNGFYLFESFTCIGRLA
jgi:hypothetical protein